MTPLLLVAHGSRDPRAAATTRALARVVAAARPGLDVRVSFLELAEPGPATVLRALGEPAVVVPLLLTKAYHGRIDLPAQVAGFDVTLTEPLGEPSPDLLAGLAKRLHAAVGEYDGLVVAAAGTRMAEARVVVEETAAALGAQAGVPVRVAYAAGATPTGAEAVGQLKSLGARRIAVAAYFLACGQLYDTVMSSALEAGAIAAAEPLGASWDLARLILKRYDTATTPDSDDLARMYRHSRHS
ncbi:sirohydrochlorin chelatase [Hamadaea tsunoensis]|uniref:sirohydrochlorin chelatase n=1 Tax=Hamadaea tsunoensis TaxID=53368 RepID=UPI0006876FD5|nr:CbiX/SirB N-terminal domain-containing protein [Hamadaea tsunoensis]